MNKILRTFLTLVGFVSIWFIFNEGALGLNLIIGIVSSILALAIIYKVIEFDYVKEYRIPIFKFIKYIALLLVNVYVSGFHTAYLILTNKAKPGFVTDKLDTYIRSEFLQEIVANSITLTPGTITVDNNDGELTVLCIDNSKENDAPSSAFVPQIISMQKDINEYK